MVVTDYDLLRAKFNYLYGWIAKNEHLIKIDTGGFPYNNILMDNFEKTEWYNKNISIKEKGGVYYFNTNKERKDKKWKVVVYEKQE